MNRNQPTMRDVAKRAGVTQPTVSYVINGTANITDEVKERVYNAIKELNYKPNYYARALKTNKSNVIGIIIPDISNEYYARMVNLVENILMGKKYTVIINSTNYDKKAEERSIKQLISYNAAGILIMYQLGNSKCWQQLEECGIPVTVLEGGSNCGSIPCINTDNHMGGYLATKYLLDKGLRKIVYVGQTSDIQALNERCQGYIDAMTEYNVYKPESIYRTSGPSNKWKEGQVLGEKLARLNIDGIVVSSDMIAVGMIKALKLAGINIPDDISIIGYDDIPLAELFIPALTTISQPVEKMCNLGINIILADDCNTNMNTIPVFKPLLIKRETA